MRPTRAQATPLFDKVVFSKLAARLGGRVRMILSGGAPLAPHTEEFLKVTTGYSIHLCPCLMLLMVHQAYLCQPWRLE